MQWHFLVSLAYNHYFYDAKWLGGLYLHVYVNLAIKELWLLIKHMQYTTYGFPCMTKLPAV
jgi:hypothetical protein